MVNVEAIEWLIDFYMELLFRVRKTRIRVDIPAERRRMLENVVDLASIRTHNLSHDSKLSSAGDEKKRMDSDKKYSSLSTALMVH